MISSRHSSHPDQATLLLAAEDEASLGVLEHIAHCTQCQVRLGELLAAEGSITAVEEVQGREAAHERLFESLQAATAQPRQPPLLQPRFWLNICAVGLLLAVTWAGRRTYGPLQERLDAYENTGPKPNPILTPGAVNAAKLAELCAQADSNLDPQVSPEKERAVFASYGLGEREARSYQVDYLINPQLGGNDEAANLWPEPYHATVWNATAKDALETKLHGMVCRGEVSLKQAQNDLASDWIEAYKRYFHTARPARTVATVGDAK